MALVYVACGLALVAYAAVLLVFQRAVGVPARVRNWMNPFASPLIALVGCCAYAPVAALLVLAASRLLSLPFELNSSTGDIIWYVGCGVVVCTVAFFAARWWQPLYLAGATVGVGIYWWVLEGQPTSERFEEIVPGVLLVGALTSVAVLLRFAHMARLQRRGSGDTGLRIELIPADDSHLGDGAGG